MTTPPRSPRLLMLSTVLLIVAGFALMPHGRQAPTSTAPVTSSTASTDPPRVTATALLNQPLTPTTSSTASATAARPSAVQSALPPHGEGVAGDRAIQRSLQAAWPADLPADDVRELLAASRALLRADATGTGRAKWPGVFRHPGQAVAPAFATARFRIQAAIARRDGSPNRAVVHLVWAGTDRGGTFIDGRITDWHFTRTPPTKGAAKWTPQPRT